MIDAANINPPYDDLSYINSYGPNNLFWKLLKPKNKISIKLNIPDTIVVN